MHRDIPPGFDHDPTSWRRRGVLIALAAAGFFVAGYLTLYQFGAFASVWDPVFGSRASRAVLDLTAPVPDAVAGVLAYAGEIVLLAIGRPGRWRTMPWTCLALGLVLVTGVIASIALIVVQATVVGDWCVLCLCSAGLSFALFALGIGEARAALRQVSDSRDRGVGLGNALRGVRR